MQCIPLSWLVKGDSARRRLRYEPCVSLDVFASRLYDLPNRAALSGKTIKRSHAGTVLRQPRLELQSMTVLGSRVALAGKTRTLVLGIVFCIAVSGIAAAKDTKDLYSEKCASCHAADGSGHTAAAAKMKVPDLRSKRIKQISDDDLYAATAEGKSHEEYPHGFLHLGLTEDQIRDLIKYIRTFGDNRK